MDGAAVAGAEEAVEARAKAVEGLLASCTATSSEGVVGVGCTDLSGALPAKFLLSVTAIASGDAQPKPALGAEPARFHADQAFPLTLTVHADRASGSTHHLADTRLDQTITLTEPTAEPVLVRLPYDFWPVSLSATSFVLLTLPARAISVSPWSVASGSQSTFEELNAGVSAGAPTELALAVPRGEMRVDAKLTVDGITRDVAFDGPGAYIAGAAGLAHGAELPAPAAPNASDLGAPENFLACHAGDSTIDGAPVHCTVRAPADVPFVGPVRVELRDAADTQRGIASVPADGTTATLGTCAVAPCHLGVSMVVHVPGEVSPRVLETKLALENASQATPARLRLPFDVWSLDIDHSTRKVVDLVLGPDDGALPVGWTSDRALTFGGRNGRPDAGAPVVFAVPVGTTTRTGSIRVLDLPDTRPDVTIVETPITVTRGTRYRVEGFDLVPVP